MQITAKKKVSEEANYQEIIDAILSVREIEDKKNFLESTLPDLGTLIDDLDIGEGELQKVKDLVDQAIASKQKICVYGDYDADGITATAVMWLTLVSMGAIVLPFIPSRTRHGYGLSDASVTELLSGTGFGNTKYKDFVPDLIITVDNGIVAGRQIDSLRAAGKSIIITDHHQIGENIPNSNALVHTTKTSGAGISWIVSRYISNDSDFAKRRIDLATIGIVADQMPVVGANRPIIKSGLKAIEQTNLLGLQTILAISGISNRSLTTYDINFGIAPRINAVGRIDNAIDALRLLCTGNKDLARELSESMDALNKERQSLTDTAILDALKHIDDNKITVVASPNYHHGVIGLIAGKLAEKAKKPAVVMSIDGELTKGSARSVAGVDITKLLRKHQGLLSGVGGHEQAAGFSLPTANLDEFVEALIEDANQSISDNLVQDVMVVDLELPLSTTTIMLASAINTLEPYGIGNQKPRFVSYDLTVIEDRAMGDMSQHHKLTVRSGGATRTVLWFNGQAVKGKIKSLVYTLDINNWQGKQELQLIAAYVEL